MPYPTNIPEPPVVTVSQVNRVVSMLIKGDNRLKNVAVRGEVSNFVRHSKTGHFYFTLTDGSTQLKAVMFAGNASLVDPIPENGDTIVCRGQIVVYEPSGVYQINCTDIRPDGEGDQAAALEALKRRLIAEGLFSQKRERPQFPKKVAVVTAPGGAALQDIINIIGRRCPVVTLVVVPVLVQGADAPRSIAQGLADAQDTGADVIIVGRGGGSAEDLAAFNTETVVRAVFASKIPTISAVGHETDTTLCDYAADLRAPTPSAAAELAVPDSAELVARLDGALAHIARCAGSNISSCERTLTARAELIRARSPRSLILSREQRLLAAKEAIMLRMRSRLDAAERSLAQRAGVISALDPLGVLARGFSLTKHDGRVVMSSRELSAGDSVEIRFSCGSAAATITEIRNEDGF